MKIDTETLNSATARELTRLLARNLRDTLLGYPTPDGEPLFTVEESGSDGGIFRIQSRVSGELHAFESFDEARAFVYGINAAQNEIMARN